MEDWPEAGPPVLWIRNLGQGYSSFAAKGDRVFTQAQNITGQYLYCLEADTGSTIWEYRYDWPYEAAGVYPGPRGTPTLYDDKVYFTSPDGLLACLQQADGRLVWSVDLLAVYGINGCDFGYACSPTVVDNLAIVPVGGPDAGMVAFDHATGKEIWKATSEPASYTPAYPIELNGEPLVIGYMQNSVIILNRTTGSLKRKISLSRGYDEHSAWPIYSEPFLWLAAPFQAGSYCLDLTNLNTPDQQLETVWRSKKMSNDVCSSVLVDGHIYGFDIRDVQSKTHRPSRGVFRCIDFMTAEEKWSVGTGNARRSSNADEYANDILQSGIIAADGKLIILNELGELILLKQDSRQCVELARCMVLGGELTWTPPCLCNGRIFVRNQSQAACIYLGDLSNLSQVNTMNAGDLPQRKYYNWASAVLAVEPEYAFDIPHDRWLLLWFNAGLVIIVVGKLSTKLVPFAKLQATDSLSIRAPTVEFLTLFCLGAIGTTALGHLSGEFIFTWHICLYAALEFVAATSSIRQAEGAASAWRQRLPMLALLTVTFLYYLACRRLSLVFEWAFMIGFVGALPVVWMTNRIPQITPKHSMTKLFVSVIGYTCFYATTVMFLKTRF